MDGHRLGKPASLQIVCPVGKAHQQAPLAGESLGGYGPAVVIRPGGHAVAWVAWCRPGRIPAVTSYLLGPFTEAVFRARSVAGASSDVSP